MKRKPYGISGTYQKPTEQRRWWEAGGGWRCREMETDWKAEGVRKDKSTGSVWMVWLLSFTLLGVTFALRKRRENIKNLTLLTVFNKKTIFIFITSDTGTRGEWFLWVWLEENGKSVQGEKQIRITRVIKANTKVWGMVCKERGEGNDGS